MRALLVLFSIFFCAYAVDDGPIIGIDLGTTYSCVAIYKSAGNAEVIANEQGARTMPSWVHYSDDGILVGEGAKNVGLLHPMNTIFDVKRLVGRRFDDPVLQRDIKHLPYKIVDKDGAPYVEIMRGGKRTLISPEEISAQILAAMKRAAELYLGEPVKRAVVTVLAPLSLRLILAGPSLFYGCATAGYQGRWCHRWSQGRAHYQRAHCSCYNVRHGEEG
jgi:endoplasmic reticulum chaperone BiP